ncbi:MAG: cephalosporin hydroxylase [Bradymonadia bacterium]|jgi:cephalosporin hydroxylase
MNAYSLQPIKTLPDPDAQTLDDLRDPWMLAATTERYVFGFEWMGRPIVQLPQDIVGLQQLHERVRPDLVIETGVAHGGSLVFHASMMKLHDTNGEVLGIDIALREENRRAILDHPMADRIQLLQGSSVSESIVAQVKERAKTAQRVLVVLDSNHSHEHVYAELQAYADLVTPGSYIVVFDTAIEDLPEGFFQNRPWDKSQNPKTAVREFMSTRPDFIHDDALEEQLSITAAPEGWWRKVRS